MSARLTASWAAALLLAAPSASAEEPTPDPAPVTPPDLASVRVVADTSGMRLQVDGKDFLVVGMNWGYTPIGQNYRYDLWSQPDDFVRAALDRDMTLLRKMGVNAIRVFSDVPPRWVRYIHDKHGIHTAVNHLLGRYGFLVDGTFVNPVDYSDPAFRKAVLADLAKTIERYRGVPGVIMVLLGNENNYGLVWTSFEIEQLPPESRERGRAEKLYELMGEAVATVKATDPSRLVALTNGDLQYLDLIKTLVVPRGLDIMGANVYRGASARDLFQRVRDELGLPFVFTEFGADAYDARRGREDDVMQARYLAAQWREIYAQSAGKGGAGNAAGGFIFQWVDGWWKYLQETALDVHDTHASWSNEGYLDDFVPGGNNMNEEWFGICALAPAGADGIAGVVPRTAYYVLKEAFRLDPYAPTTDVAAIDRHWDTIDPDALAVTYASARAAAEVEALGRFRVRDVRLDLATYVTGGKNLTDAARDEDGRFDHQQSFTLDVEARPVSRVRARVAINVLGRVAENPIDEIRYEARGRPRTVVDEAGERLVLEDLERVKLYAASVTWDEDLFTLDAFFRTGHYHWGYEGDAFGLYPEAFYGNQVDVYDADAPIGLSFTGKGDLEGLRLAFGPQLWWGANPALIGTYRRAFGPLTLTLVHHEDIAAQGTTVTSSAVPERVNRRTSLAAETKVGAVKVEVAGLVSGTTKIGEVFMDAEPTSGPSYADSGYLVTRDRIAAADTLGAKLKLSGSAGPVHAYLQGGYRGLVADGGGDWTVTYTGWSLKEAGRGNHWAVSGGAAIQLGHLQIAPNLLYQAPLVGPMPTIDEALDLATGTYYPGLRARSILDAPFAVLDNRETLGAELLLTWDPTPGTWLWAWDNEIVEDAPLAGSLDIVFRHHPTSRDALLGFTEDGVVFAFPGAPPAADLVEVNARLVANPGRGVRLLSRLYVGEGQARGDDPRRILRWGGDLRVAWDRLVVQAFAKFDDWGPYDYHRDFNYTFPVQLMVDLAWGATTPEWLGRLFTKVGVRGQFRSLDAHSNRFAADPLAPDDGGHEWEIMTYMQVTLGGAP
ncbi:MAG: hypothetical protein IT385_01425 [Deltaproteobacteria bacterium]|nr:hypothetical protein [Deltaproteobacteria bacterium]